MPVSPAPPAVSTPGSWEPSRPSIPCAGQLPWLAFAAAVAGRLLWDRGHRSIHRLQVSCTCLQSAGSAWKAGVPTRSDADLFSSEKIPLISHLPGLPPDVHSTEVFASSAQPEADVEPALGFALPSSAVVARCAGADHHTTEIPVDRVSGASHFTHSASLLSLSLSTADMMSMLDHIPSSSCPDDAWVCEAALAALAHSDGAPRPFACTEPGCFQRFKRKFTLKEHIKTHTGEKPFACPVASCGKTFTTSGNLARHKRLHPWLKPLICHVESCRRSFSSEEKLEAHVKSHFDGSRSHRCSHPGCGKDFSTAGNLTRHIKQQHLQEIAPAPLVIAVTLDKVSPAKEDVMASPTGVDSGAFLEWPGSPPPLDLDCQTLLPMGDPDMIEALAFLLE
ncbi:hypothetical protein PINS_up020261 [Pythium insidiosum]|nr:hypothetical protein PINS_up020261 [Pythium insidiosum]